MGAGYTKADEDLFVSELYTFAQSSGLMPDISIDESVMKYSGLNSTAVLEGYTSQLQSDLVAKVPDYMESLGSSIASLKGVPNAVGLGALIISFILDLAIKSVASESDGSTLNMLHRVFAEEKASSVRDSMHECLKRLSMHVREPPKVLKEIERLEKHLSDQLTRLRNSMLHDNQMSSRAMKHWVNGAAFHSQMLIHVARLEAQISSSNKSLENQVASIDTMVDLYWQDLQELLKKYKSYKSSTIKLYKKYSPCFMRACAEGCVLTEGELGRTEELFVFSDFFYALKNCAFKLDAYVNYMFDTWDQVQKLEGYFSDLKKNIKELILQHQEFSMKNT